MHGQPSWQSGRNNLPILCWVGVPVWLLVHTCQVLRIKTQPFRTRFLRCSNVNSYISKWNRCTCWQIAWLCFLPKNPTEFLVLWCQAHDITSVPGCPVCGRSASNLATSVSSKTSGVSDEHLRTINTCCQNLSAGLGPRIPTSPVPSRKHKQHTNRKDATVSAKCMQIHMLYMFFTYGYIYIYGWGPRFSDRW